MINYQPASEDLALLEALGSQAVKAATFDHREHLRMAYAHLCSADVETSTARIRESLCALLKHLGVDPASKYHETMTRAWVEVVAVAMRQGKGADSAAEFLDQHRELLSPDWLKRHYSPALLDSQLARTQFVEPDLLSFDGIPIGKDTPPQANQQ